MLRHLPNRPCQQSVTCHYHHFGCRHRPSLDCSSTCVTASTGRLQIYIGGNCPKLSGYVMPHAHLFPLNVIRASVDDEAYLIKSSASSSCSCYFSSCPSSRRPRPPGCCCSAAVRSSKTFCCPREERACHHRTAPCRASPDDHLAPHC